MLFKYCAECGHELEDIKCGDDDCKICPLHMLKGEVLCRVIIK